MLVCELLAFLFCLIFDSSVLRVITVMTACTHQLYHGLLFQYVTVYARRLLRISWQIFVIRSQFSSVDQVTLHITLFKIYHHHIGF